MEYLFSALDDLDAQTLVILGNGFDLAHGIKSGYSHFKQWLIQEGLTDVVNLMDIFFSNKRDVWGDIEQALGEYDEDSILEFCVPDFQLDPDHFTRTVAKIEDAPDSVFAPFLEQLKMAFREWVNQIDVQKNKLPIHFSEKSKYLTFNYTDTLEKLYGIPSAQILHIHGSRLLDQDDYVFGHSNLRVADMDNLDENGNEIDLFFIHETKVKIVRWMNEWIKDQKGIIRSHRDFFDGLSDTEQVYVLGHSFADVDIPYMMEIVKQIGNDKHWTISCYNRNDLCRIEKFIERAQLTHVKYI